jgi:hypothetical protein
MMAMYEDRLLSARYSLMSIPSVMYLSFVAGDVQSSNRIVYPTS